MDSSLAGHGRCPTADSKKSAHKHKGLGRIFNLKVNCWSAFGICPCDSVHHNQLLVGLTICQTGSIKGVMALLCQAHRVIIVISCPQSILRGQVRHDTDLQLSCHISCIGLWRGYQYPQNWIQDRGGWGSI